MTALAFLLVAAGALLIYAGLTGQNVLAETQRVLSGGKKS